MRVLLLLIFTFNLFANEVERQNTTTDVVEEIVSEQIVTIISDMENYFPESSESP